MIKLRIFFAALLLFFGSQALLSAKKKIVELDKYLEKLIKKKALNKTELKALIRLAMKNDPLGDQAAYILANYYLKEGKPVSALYVLNRKFDTMAKLSESTWKKLAPKSKLPLEKQNQLISDWWEQNHFIPKRWGDRADNVLNPYSMAVLAKILRKAGNDSDPVEIGYALTRQNNQPVLKVHGAATVAEIFFDSRNLKKAEESCDWGLKYHKNLGRSAESRALLSSLDKGLAASSLKIFNDIKNRIKRIREIEKFGADYCLFRDGDRAKAKKQNVLAWLYYTEVINLFPETMASDAAALKRVQLFEGEKWLAPDLKTKKGKPYNELQLVEGYLDKKRDAHLILALDNSRSKRVETLKMMVLPDRSKVIADFMKHPNRLYREEIHLHLARAMLRVGEKELAEKLVERSFDHIKKARRLKSVEKRFPLSDALAKESAPPESRSRTEFSISPGTYFNRQVCDWYLDYLECETIALSGLIKAIDGKYEESKAIFSKLTEKDETWKSLVKRNEPNAPGRLMIAVSREELLADRDEQKLFDGKDKTRLGFADYQYLMGEFRQAKTIYVSLLKNRKRSRSQAAYLHYALAQCKYWTDSKNKKAAWLEFEKVLGFGKTPTYEKAAYCLGNVGMWLDKDTQDRTESYLKQLINSSKGKYQGPWQAFTCQPL
jgi:hypothetical protein